MIKKPRQCGKCGFTGHNARSCKNTGGKAPWEGLVRQIGAPECIPSSSSQSSSSGPAFSGATTPDESPPAIDLTAALPDLNLGADPTENPTTEESTEETSHSTGPTEEKRRVDADTAAKIASASFIAFLSMGNKYIADNGGMPLSDSILQLNGTLVEELVRKNANKINMAPEELGTLIVGGSTLWVAGQGILIAMRKKRQDKDRVIYEQPNAPSNGAGSGNGRSVAPLTSGPLRDPSTVYG